MTSGAPWSVKGIDPKAREIAKDLARRSGMTLGEWLNQMILDDGPEAATPEPPRQPTPQPSRRRFDPRPAAPVQRLEAPPSPADEEEDFGRIAEALDRLSTRIESAEHRSTLAISGMDQSVMGVLSRIEAAERTQNQVAARFEGVIEDVRADQLTLAERLAQLEKDRTGARSAEALKSLEGALTRVASHLYEGEGRTRDSIGALKQEIDGLAYQVRQSQGGNDPGGVAALVDQVVARIAERLEQAEGRTSTALKGLQGSFASLDERLRSAEERLETDAPTQRRFEQLASDLSRRVEDVRNELADRLKDTAGGRGDRLDGVLREMTSHVQAAEQRSAQAIERMGQEVVRMTDQLNQKVAGVEQRSADAIGKVSGEMTRIADAVEGRLKRADTAQAEALEKLGGEIARITERLAERISTAERRSAQSMDDVGEQMSRVTERLQQRHERASSELIDRMRQSEERTARLLDEAREKIDQRLADAQRKLAEATPPVPPIAPPGYADPFGGPFAQSYPPSGAADFGAHAFSGPGFLDQPFTPPAPYAEPDYPTPPSAAEAPDVVPEAVYEDAAAFGASTPPAPDFNDSDFDGAADDFEPVEAIDEAPEPDFDAAEPEELAPNSRNASTRELIAQARAAAKAAAEATDKKGRKGKEPKTATGGGPKADNSSLFSGFGIGRKKKAETSALKTALLMSATAAFLGIGAAGVVIQNGGVIAGWGGGQDNVVPETAVNVAEAEEGAAPASAPLDPKLALAMAPTSSMAPEPPSAEAQALYQQGVQAIDGGDASGLEPLRRSANLGYAPAQYYLAKLYVDGAAGLKKDPAEARRWSARAAANGDPRAMHQLATFYYNGEGGEQNAVAGYEWFKKAAALGFVDSQFNLGVMNEGGMGVPLNHAEAYKWFVIAGRAGDAGARDRAQKLQPKLSAAQRGVAERAAASFKVEAPNPSATPPTALAASGAPAVATAQRALSRMGYYQGPSDGAQSAALRLAVVAYQRDQGLPTNGVLTPELVQRFANASR